LLGKFTVLSPHQKVSHEFNYLNIVAYYRLILPELIPIQYEKVIYLDCDLVVLNDLGQLWDLSLNDNYALAVPDLFGYSIVRLPNYQELGITPDRKYFNSGVLVLNLKKWRLDEVTSKCVTYLKQERENVLYHDQDVLNAILGNDWAELDPRWNVTPAIHHVPCEKSPYEEALYKSLFSNPYIVHYSTAAKPWGTHNLAFNDSFPFKDIFFHYLDMTVWSGWRLTARRLLAAKLSRKFRLLQAITGN
jgi:lipopolysaccharide biosynthesis glycosyltransferase